MHRSLFLFAILAGFLPSAFGQAWSGILNPVTSGFPGSTTSPNAYGIDWTVAGVGGIPARTTISSTVNAAPAPCLSGAGDCTSTIQNALNAAASGTAVVLGAGTFKVASAIHVPSNVTLRGSGANQTIVNGTGSGSAPITMGSGAVSYTGALSITAGATAGSTSLTVSSTSGATVGGYLVISETNNPAFVTLTGTEGNCTWCDGWSTQGTRARGEITQIQAISGSTITIYPGLTSPYTNTPTAVPFSAAASYAGIENLQIYANNSGYANQIYMSKCAFCWAVGIEYNYSDGNPIEVDWGYRDEIDNSYVSNAFTHQPGSTDSAIFIVLKSSYFLVQNNVLERQHVGVILEWGACCGVVAYNYSSGNFDNGNNPSNCAPGTGACPLMSGFLHHGAHPQFNLWEGNVGEQLYLDSVWGSSSHDTSFRGWYIGTSHVCTPFAYGSGGRTAVTNPCYYAFQAARATQISQISRYDNFVGDLWGSSQQSAIASPTAVIVAPTNRAYDGATYNATFGYGEASDSGSGGGDNAVPYTSALIHGVFTNANAATTWASGLTHTLPCSFYLSSCTKPSWWPSALRFPGTGPDVSGGTGPGGHSYGNPAMTCYASMGGVDGGVGSPLDFNAANCYSGAMPAPALPRLSHTTQSGN